MSFKGGDAPVAEGAEVSTAAGQTWIPRLGTEEASLWCAVSFLVVPWGEPVPMVRCPAGFIGTSFICCCPLKVRYQGVAGVFFGPESVVQSQA